MTTVDLMYFNAGGGHRAAARALTDALAMHSDAWNVRSLDLFDLLDPRHRFERATGFAPEAYYNRRLARGWTIGLAQELKLLQGLIRLGKAPMVRRLERHWRRTRPDLVVSLVPNFNFAMQEALGRAMPGVPFVNLLTDMADYPPHFWMEAPNGQHVICGTAFAYGQARAAGHPATHVHRTSGMIIRPEFYAPNPGDRARELERLGLDPSRPTGVVMFGGEGSISMLKIARALTDVQLILMCGRHASLMAALREEVSQAPRAVIGFSAKVREHMELGDFFIGKPGPGSLSEAIQCGLPVVTLKNAWTLPQERYNADWVLEMGLGMVAESSSGIRPAVLDVMRRLGDFKKNVRAVRNRAIFEVPGILARIVSAPEPQPDRSPLDVERWPRRQFPSLSGSPTERI